MDTTIAALWQQAQQFELAGNGVQAEQIYRQILQKEPSNAQVWHQLGLLAYGVNNLEAAFQNIAQAVRLDPQATLYHRNLGEISRRSGKLDQAILSGKAACALSPNDIDAHYNLGLSYTDSEQYTKAIFHYRKAIKLNPRHGLSWNNLGSALEQRGDKSGALKAYEKAVELNPQNAEAQNNQGAIYSEEGKLDDARISFSAAIAARPDFVEAHYNLSSLKTYTVEDPHLIMLEGVYAKRDQLNYHARIRYDFALGKALDDIGQYDRAFAAYEEGNRLHHAILLMDEVRADSLVKSIIELFTPEYLAKKLEFQPIANSPTTPIFIVGMPRSGTTLLEQILSTHPSVYGAGELTVLNEVVMKMTKASEDKLFTHALPKLSKANLQKLAKDYLHKVSKLSPESTYITDKMPSNFFYIGLIYLAFPNAKIIHAMRDPMDSCFSCYSRLFNDTMEFAYDQGTLGRYYQRYMRLMAHWKKVLPPGIILDLPYESLVENTEKEARRVLEYVGLPWDEKCLQFYKNDRIVKTASIAQVRRPIYKTSIARWKPFAKHLLPLYELVKKFRDPQDATDFERALDISDGSVLLSRQGPQATNLHDLLNQCLTHQGKDEHEAVVMLLSHQLLQSEQRIDDVTAANLWHLQGISLYRLNRFEEALESYERGLRRYAQFPALLNSMGFLLQDIGRMREARDRFGQALSLAPEMAMARLNLGMAQLKLGDFANGWDNYEARWTGSAESNLGTFVRPACPLPQWSGEGGTHNQRLLVITEQGFGDTFQFVRYLPEIAPRFSKVGFVCSVPTLRLMEWAYAHSIVLFTHLPLDYGAWDLQCSLMSLPRACQTRLESIPGITPYLKVVPPAKQHWLDRLENIAPQRMRVGIAWAGRKAHQYDARRSLTFEKLSPLLNTPFVTWVSLQKWAPEEVRPQIPKEIDWVDWTEELIDFADTAALVDSLDLVISIDSSMVHLAGALNKPVWMLNRFDSEWRWLEGRTDSPWYPNLRIFNQPQFGDWNAVITSVCLALQNLPIPQVPAKTKIIRALPSPSDTNLVSSVHHASSANLSIEQAIQLAGQFQAGGRLEQAEQVLRHILKIDPKHAHALHLLGVVTYQAGQTILAMDLMRQAIVSDPSVALFESNFAEMCRQQGRLEEAIEHGKKAIQLDATLSSAYSNLGIALFDIKNYDAAQEAHEKALAINGQLLQSLNNLGSIERARNNQKGAVDWYRKALAINGDFIESLINLGAVLVEEDRAEDALPVLLKVLTNQPNSAEGLCNLGLAYYKLEEFDKAQSLLRRSLLARPGYIEAMVGLARVLQEVDGFSEALGLLQEVVAKEHLKSDAWCLLGTLYTEMAESDLAKAAYQSALDADGEKNADALTGLANLALEEGDISKAKALLRKALNIDPENLAARFHLTQAAMVKEGDENFSSLKSLEKNIDSLSNEKKISIHYALGKGYDDLGEFSKAFHHFLEGARFKRSKLKFSSKNESEHIDRIIGGFTSECYARLLGGGNNDASPIFILGMPRSGTTLTEQIISSHSQVHGAGELRYLLDVIQDSLSVSGGEGYPNNLIDLNCDKLIQWGRQYIDRLRSHHPSALRITDKMPANYLALGLIPLMLPKAKIIHVKRNPIDTCVSCFTRLFNRHQEATYDLQELGRHYKNYARLMDHWRSILPKESFFEVEYEHMVCDIEAEARRLIEWVGLEWDPACLAFYENKRSIRTASLTQVRQPIYSSSVERWRNYEDYLGPLLAELELPLRPQ